MNCSNCDQKIEADSIFCPSCGTKVESIQSDSRPIDKDILSHLEFLGYEIESNDATPMTLAKHKNRSNVLMSTMEVGTSFLSIYKLDQQKVQKDYLSALELVNRLNNQSIFVSFSLANDSSSLLCSALYMGNYRKQEFADFIDLYESDIQARLASEKYLEDLN